MCQFSDAVINIPGLITTVEGLVRSEQRMLATEGDKIDYICQHVTEAGIKADPGPDSAELEGSNPPPTDISYDRTGA